MSLNGDIVESSRRNEAWRSDNLPAMSRRSRTLLWLLVAAVTLFVAGPWVYINVIREPAADSFLNEFTSTTFVAMGDTASDTTESPAGDTTLESLADPNGVWNVSTDSQVGYRVDEVLFGQNVTAIGRTEAVSGSVTINDFTVTAATFTIDMTTVKSDEPKRDAQFASRVMDTLNFPTATFVLDSPVGLDGEAATGNARLTATGTLTLRGTSKPISLNIVSSVRDGRLLLVGETTIVFAEWGIPNPSIPGISTEDSGILEFSLVLER